MNNGVPEMQVQNEFNQNLNGGFQGGNDRNNVNQWQAAGGNAHNGWQNGGVVGYNNRNAAGAPYQGGGHHPAQYSNHGGINRGNNAFQQLNGVPGQAIPRDNHGGVGQVYNPAQNLGPGGYGMAPRSGLQPPMRVYNNPDYRGMARMDPNMSLAEVIQARSRGASNM